MKLVTPAFMLSVCLVTAAPTNQAMDAASADMYTVANDNISTLNLKKPAARFTCGQYKFADGTVQEFYSQVWAGYPADQMICRYFKYEFRDKKGQKGKMVSAKVDKGCTCFFYESPCDPNQGLAEKWEGWMGWQNFVGTDKDFKGWYCFEQN